jgi:hypothetical protein
MYVVPITEVLFNSAKLRVCGDEILYSIAEWLQRLAVNAKVAPVLGSMIRSNIFVNKFLLRMQHNKETLCLCNVHVPLIGSAIANPFRHYVLWQSVIIP